MNSAPLKHSGVHFEIHTSAMWFVFYSKIISKALSVNQQNIRKPVVTVGQCSLPCCKHVFAHKLNLEAYTV